MRRLLYTVLFLCALGVAPKAGAQYYTWGSDPAGLKWSTIRTPDVRMIYPDTVSAVARRTLFYIRSVRPDIGYGFRHGPMRIPFVMHPENFQSNGLVMYLPKRVEFLTSPAVDSYSMPWYKQLVAHEYRHAVQYNNLNRGVIRALSYVLGQQGSTIGLLCLMAQCGLHIPADSGSAVRVFHRVLADVGDEQSIEQSLSTFSAHMSNIVQILREVDDQSLLLFDELGAGTDPIEGAALAIAIIESARSQGALIAATTHYAELKTFAMTTAGVENASCEFDVQTLRPTYRLLIGIPGKSNAFAISRRLGLDESVIQAAQAQMDSDSVRFEDVLTQLEEKRQRLEKAQAEADRLWRQREEDARKARTFREQMEKAKDNARTKGEAEAKRIVRQAQAQADEIFAQLDQLRRQQQKQLSFQELNDAKAAVRHSLNQAQDALHIHDQPQEPVYTPSRPIEVGDLVELPGVKMAASVLAVNNDGTLLLQAGKMKMTVKAQQVRLPDGQPKKKPAAPASGGSAKLNLQSRAASELDIRGYETLEAESVVENYIDSAVMAKLGTVTIIHGKGTGALRKAVHEMLKRNKAVKSFRLGRYGEGEAGVTVVELK